MIDQYGEQRALRKALLFASSLAVIAVASAPATAWAASRPVDHCGQELTQPGDYHLTQDIGPCTGHGVVITASDVRFTLAGHTIAGVSSAASCDMENPQTGVDVRSPATGVRVSGGTVTGFVDGISLSADSRVTAMRVVDNCFWGVIVTGAGRVDTSVVSGSGNDGIALCQAQDALVTANEVVGSRRYGISMSCDVGANDRNRVVRNILRDNGAPGGDGGGIAVFTGNDHRIVGNAISENFLGIFLLTTTGSTVRDNTVNANRDGGIVLTDGAHGTVVRANTAYSNTRVDLQDDNPGCGTNDWARDLFRTDIVAGAPDGGPSQGCIR
jgi:parallel beta-helix repeat protein